MVFVCYLFYGKGYPLIIYLPYHHWLQWVQVVQQVRADPRKREERALRPRLLLLNSNYWTAWLQIILQSLTQESLTYTSTISASIAIRASVSRLSL